MITEVPCVHQRQKDPGTYQFSMVSQVTWRWCGPRAKRTQHMEMHEFSHQAWYACQVAESKCWKPWVGSSLP